MKMFSRNTEKLESFVGSASHFKGDIKTKGTLRIDGALDGNVEADWLVLGEKAHVKGNVTACGVIVGGKIEGTIFSWFSSRLSPCGMVVVPLAIAHVSPSFCTRPASVVSGQGTGNGGSRESSRAAITTPERRRAIGCRTAAAPRSGAAAAKYTNTGNAVNRKRGPAKNPSASRTVCAQTSSMVRPPTRTSPRYGPKEMRGVRPTASCDRPSP